MEQILLIALTVLTALLFVVVLLMWRKLSDLGSGDKLQLDALRQELEDQQRKLRLELGETTQFTVKSLGEMVTASQNTKFTDIQTAITQQLDRLDKRFASFAIENEQKLDNIRKTMETRLTYIQEDNNVKLDKMREIVDEKLQKTLEDKMTQSFQLVNERLEQVYKGLGEMQTLATGVGDLKKVLSNVKTRGILGEIQLGAILEEILAPEQYEANVITKRGSKAFVEYAIKLPTEEGPPVYLPIDSKFPGDAYSDLQDAYEEGSKEAVQEAWAMLRTRIRTAAKDIRDKYVDPPGTTEFAVLFLPFEGLYAEVVNRGMVEELQRDYKVNIAGPSTMAALLNSLQMGFRTFAIQKRSGEVWSLLSAVKTEFDTFATALTKTQERLKQADDELEKLVGVRTRQMQRKLKNVSSLTDHTAKEILFDGVEPVGDTFSEDTAGMPVEV